MSPFWFVLLFSVAEAGKRCLTTNDCTSIDDYVWRPDNTYTYSLIQAYPMDGFTTYILNMTSQTWFNETVHTHPVWWHYLAIHIPDTVNYNDGAFLYISTGNNRDGPPSATSNTHIRRTGLLSNSSGMVYATLRMIPNQPIGFNLNDTILEKSEDGLIAYTWRLFADEILNNQTILGPDILLRNPMTKACVRAMDAITSFVQAQVPSTDIQRFIVAGESKRGWTTWITAATDDRVVGQVPVVLSCLNMIKNFNHYWRANGGWSFALGNYWMEGLLGYINHPLAQRLADLIDPYVYRNRYTFPTFMIGGSSDEFFMNDDHHYFWSDMLQPHSMTWIMENTRHSISGSPVVEEYWANLETFSYYIFEQGYTFPQPRWMRNETATHGSITVYCDQTPVRITSFWALTPEPENRDWRVAYVDHSGLPELKQRNVTWFEEPVMDLGGNTFQVEVEKPSEGWVAFFIKMHFSGPFGRLFTVSTEANIVPDVFPYTQCRTFDECQGILL